MNTVKNITSSRKSLMFQPRHLLLIEIVGSQHRRITELIAALALRGPLYTIAGSDWVPSYGLARLLRHKTVEVKCLLDRTRLARAFTCYQMLDLLAGTRPDANPVVVLDFLHTFHSPDIPLYVRLRVLKQCCRHLERLSYYEPVAILIQQTKVEDYQQLHSIVSRVADEIFQTDEVHEETFQPALF
jgi:hypothetical protein